MSSLIGLLFAFLHLISFSLSCYDSNTSIVGIWIPDIWIKEPFESWSTWVEWELQRGSTLIKNLDTIFLYKLKNLSSLEVERLLHKLLTQPQWVRIRLSAQQPKAGWKTQHTLGWMALTNRTYPNLVSSPRLFLCLTFRLNACFSVCLFYSISFFWIIEVVYMFISDSSDLAWVAWKV